MGDLYCSCCKQVDRSGYWGRREREKEREAERKLRQAPHFHLGWAFGEDNCPYSEWTIIVKVSNQEDKGQSYSVHSKMLGCKSKYFERMHSSTFTEKRESTSKFELPVEIANDFALFLDCIYSPCFFGPLRRLVASVEDDASISSDCVESEYRQIFNRLSSMWYLIDYFQIDHARADMVENIFRFVADGDEIYTCQEFYKILKGVSYSCSVFQERFEVWGSSILSSSMYCSGGYNSVAEFVELVNIDYFVASFQRKERRRDREVCSDYLAVFLKHHNPDVKIDIFLSLTSLDQLPKISANAAVHFLHLIPSYQKNGDGFFASDLQRLESRCLERLREWLSVLSPEDTEIFLPLLLDHCRSPEAFDKFSASLNPQVANSFLMLCPESDNYEKLHHPVLAEMESRCMNWLCDFFRNEPLHEFDKVNIGRLHFRSIKRLFERFVHDEVPNKNLSAVFRSRYRSDIASEIREHLRQFKEANATNVPVYVEILGDLAVKEAFEGTYRPAANGSYAKIENGQEVSHIVKRGKNNWELVSNEYPNTFFVSVATSEHEGCPPFAGWKRKNLTEGWIRTLAPNYFHPKLSDLEMRIDF